MTKRCSACIHLREVNTASLVCKEAYVACGWWDNVKLPTRVFCPQPSESDTWMTRKFAFGTADPKTDRFRDVADPVYCPQFVEKDSDRCS